jgi:predicted metal-dependent phosphotriesterase family hydrolase
VEAGFSEQILLGGDMGRRTYLKSYGGGPGYAYILERFIPRLREEGIAEEAMDNFLINNPKRAFAFRGAQRG